MYTEEKAVIRTKSISPIVSLKDLGADWSEISWTKSPGASQYQVIVNAGNMLIQRDILEADIHETRLVGLLEYTAHSVEIIAIFEQNSQVLSGIIAFKTHPAQPKIEIDEISESVVEFSWSPVPDCTLYLVQLESAKNNEKEELELSSSSTSFRFQNLDFWTNYQITVTAIHHVKHFTGTSYFRTRK